MVPASSRQHRRPSKREAPSRNLRAWAHVSAGALPHGWTHSLRSSDQPMTPAIRNMKRGQSKTLAVMSSHWAQIGTLPMP